MNPEHAMNDDPLLGAIAGELSAEVYQTLANEGAEVKRPELDLGLDDAVIESEDDCVPDCFGPAVQRNEEPDPS
jgi:hypothetical protein